MKTPWRHPDWVGQPPYCGKCTEHPQACCKCVASFESGASAMLEFLTKWMNEYCKEHPPKCGYFGGYEINPLLRKDCPKCMEELKAKQ